MAGWFVLTDAGKQSPAKGLSDFGSAVVKGPTSVVFNYWLIGGAITLAAGAGVWYWQSKVAEHRGERLPLPPQQPLALPPPPSFGSSSGFGLNAGPIRVSQGVAAGGAGSPSPPVFTDDGGGGSRPYKVSRGAHVPAAARKAERAQARADLHTARRHEVEAKRDLASAKRGGFGRG